MSVRGLHTSVNYSSKLVILALLFALVLWILKRLSMKTSSLVTSNQVFQSLTKYGLNNTLAAYATAQSAHETAGFTSDVYNNYNNCFGMKTPDLSDYQYYNNIDESCLDFVNWYTRHRNKLLSLPLIIDTLADYVHFLKNQNYFEADETEYLNGCTYYFNIIFPQNES